MVRHGIDPRVLAGGREGFVGSAWHEGKERMDFATTKQQIMRELREWVRLCAIEKLRVNPKTVRWKRWQHHPTKTYRKAAEDWRKWGVRAARGETVAWNECDAVGLPLERICHAAYRAGFEDEKRRLSLAAQRRHDWTPIGTLQEHLLGTAEPRVDRVG